MNRSDWLEGKKREPIRVPDIYDFACMQCGHEVVHNPPSGRGWFCSTGCMSSSESGMPFWVIPRDKLTKAQVKEIHGFKKLKILQMKRGMNRIG